jgi:hypothetical protein
MREISETAEACPFCNRNFNAPASPRKPPETRPPAVMKPPAARMEIKAPAPPQETPAPPAAKIELKMPAPREEPPPAPVPPAKTARIELSFPEPVRERPHPAPVPTPKPVVKPPVPTPKPAPVQPAAAPVPDRRSFPAWVFLAAAGLCACVFLLPFLWKVRSPLPAPVPAPAPPPEPVVAKAPAPPPAPKPAPPPPAPVEPAPPPKKAVSEFLVQGKVFDLLTLEPVDRAAVLFTAPDSGRRFSAETGKNGGFRRQLPVDRAGYEIEIKAPGYDPDFLLDGEKPLRGFSVASRSDLASRSSVRAWGARLEKASAQAVINRDFALVPRSRSGDFFGWREGEKRAYSVFYASFKHDKVKPVSGIFVDEAVADEAVHGLRVAVVRSSRIDPRPRKPGDGEAILEESVFVVAPQGVGLWSVYQADSEAEYQAKRRQVLDSMRQMGRKAFLSQLGNWILPFPLKPGLRRAWSIGADYYYQILNSTDDKFIPERFQGKAIGSAGFMAGKWSMTRWFARGRGLVAFESLNVDSEANRQTYPLKVKVLQE